MTAGPPLVWFECDWRPLTAFGAPVLGCTLFSRWVAEMARRCDANTLATRLQGYLGGRPFLVVGDPRPKGFVPRPALALHEFTHPTGIDAKQIKARRWVPERSVGTALSRWLDDAATDDELQRSPASSLTAIVHPDLRSGFSGPCAGAATWPVLHYAALEWVIDILIDTKRLSSDEVSETLSLIGAVGFGAHAARGLGKFAVGRLRRKEWPAATGNIAYCMGLCSPPPLSRSRGNKFARYRPRIIRGWSSPSAQHARVEHAKVPLLLAEAGALFQIEEGSVINCFGQGIGGQGSLSRIEPRAVAQGYAPVLTVMLHDEGLALGATGTAEAA